MDTDQINKKKQYHFCHQIQQKYTNKPKVLSWDKLKKEQYILLASYLMSG